MARRRGSLLASIAVATGLFAAEEPAPFVITPVVEHAIGVRARASFLEEHALSPAGNLAVRVGEIGRRLAEVVDRPHVDYQFYVVQGNTPQGYSLPGGTVAVSAFISASLIRE